MFAKYSEIVQLLLLLCIIMHNCRSSPIEPVVKSPDEETTNQPQIGRSPNEDDASKSDKEIDLPESVNFINFWKFHRYAEIELENPMKISLFPAKDSERKVKKINDNAQREATNQTDINSDAQIVQNVTKESDQSSDQADQSFFFKDFDDLASFLPDPEDHKPKHRVPRMQVASYNCNGILNKLLWLRFIMCFDPTTPNPFGL
ncbi:uncharacterized protein [Linepithema humile]|uniref:uncharacterized protein n=1 Tax=Linepithema humile TaxID=83485 RepID=UPI000623398E|nr:PREDICTED: uncharacterized protein LOC105679374 [Linepithema humile]